MKLITNEQTGEPIAHGEEVCVWRLQLRRQGIKGVKGGGGKVQLILDEAGDPVELAQDATVQDAIERCGDLPARAFVVALGIDKNNRKVVLRPLPEAQREDDDDGDEDDEDDGDLSPEMMRILTTAETAVAVCRDTVAQMAIALQVLAQGQANMLSAAQHMILANADAIRAASGARSEDDEQDRAGVVEQILEHAVPKLAEEASEKAQSAQNGKAKETPAPVEKVA